MRSCAQFFIALLFVIPSVAVAQGTITGTVEEARTNEPIPGAQVFIEDLDIGTTTDAEGNYEITSAPAGEHVLEARFVGYQAQERNVTVRDGEEVVVDFALGETAVDLEEIVVTGAGGPVERRRLGNTVGSINTQELEEAPVQSFSEILQGREAGVSSMPSGGATGAGSRIRIRGLGSISQSNEPIVYIDGVRANAGGGGLDDTGVSRLDDINPNAIERVEVLKGAAAATLYGTEASNGVIQIFTKQGSEGPTRFTFEAEQSATTMPSAYEPVSGFPRTQAQADTMSRYFEGDFRPYQITEQPFFDQLFGTGHGQTYSGSLSGGSSGITYYASLRHQRENGAFQPTYDDRDYPPGVEPLADEWLRRTQATLTTTIFPRDELRLRVNAGYTDGSFSSYPKGNNLGAPISETLYSKPELVRHNNRTGAIFETVNESLQDITEQEVQRFTGSINTNYNPTSVLVLDGTFGVDFTNTINTGATPFGWNIDNFGSGDTEGTRSVTDRNDLQLTLDLAGTLTNTIGERLESTFIVGMQGLTSDTRQESVSGVNFPGPGFGVAEAAEEQSISEFQLEQTNFGVFAQEQVGFNDYLFTTLGIRFDAHSAFGSDFNAAVYPKAALSFIPSDADFWQSLGPVSSLRLRVAVGQSGLQPGAFDAQTMYAPLAAASGPGIVPDNLGNPELQPEVSTEYEIGTDLGLFSGRASLDATYWNRTVRDALVARQFAPSGGFRSAQLDNIGQLDAQGFELSLEGGVLERENVSINLFVNASYLWQEVADLGGAPDIKGGSAYTRIRNFVREGYAPASHFGAKLRDVPSGFIPVDFNGDGEPDSEEQVRTYLAGLTPETASLPGSADVVLLADEDEDGDFLDHYLGKPFPDWQGSFGGSVTLGSFRLATHFEYKAGNYYINNITKAFRGAHEGIGRNLPEAARVERNFITGGVDESFNPQNDPQVRLEALDTWLNELLSLAPFSGMNVVRSADYLRWRELSLTYNLPSNIVEGFGAERLSLTLGVRNVALFTDYYGADPELNIVGRGGTGGTYDENLNEGIEAYAPPLPRRYSFKLRVGL